MTKTHCAWHQWLEKSKPIIELRAVPYEIAFPGFADFSATVEELSLLPLSWQNSLSSAQGVYLLVCPNTGEQYVGSATGTGGFMGRWNAYAKIVMAIIVC
ncbi:MAG: hypothetical protein RIF37_02780 [Rhodospirillaceae bacterium]